jgi:acyl carrier protein
MYDIREKIIKVIEESIGDDIAFVRPESKDKLVNKLVKLYLDSINVREQKYNEGAD